MEEYKAYQKVYQKAYRQPTKSSRRTLTNTCHYLPHHSILPSSGVCQE
jgi:hypothetical protein